MRAEEPKGNLDGSLARLHAFPAKRRQWGPEGIEMFVFSDWQLLRGTSAAQSNLQTPIRLSCIWCILTYAGIKEVCAT
jgi:hypothetical protein